MKLTAIHFKYPGWLFWNQEAKATIQLEDIPEANEERLRTYMTYVKQPPADGYQQDELAEILNQPHGTLVLPPHTSKTLANYVGEFLEEIIRIRNNY